MSHLVAPEVAKRIRAAAAALGYQVNVTAAGLRTGRSGLIGVLAPDIADPGFPPILSGVTETLNAAGYATIVADVGPDPSREQVVGGDDRGRRRLAIEQAQRGLPPFLARIGARGLDQDVLRR